LERGRIFERGLAPPLAGALPEWGEKGSLRGRSAPPHYFFPFPLARGRGYRGWGYKFIRYKNRGV
jgi:hypothetical protein